MIELKQAIEYTRGVFIRDAVVPMLTQVHVTRDRVTAYNGRVLVSSPFKAGQVAGLDGGQSVTVAGRELLRAFDVLSGGKDGVRVAYRNDSKRLMLRNEKQRVSLPTGLGEAFIYKHPATDPQAWGTKDAATLRAFLPTLTALRPFVGDDSSRAWSASICITHKEAMATNNVVLAVAPAPWANVKKAPATITVPVQAVDELIRIAEAPVRIVLHKGHALEVTYSSGARLSAQLLDAEWPPAADMVESAFAKDETGLRLVKTPTLLAAIESVTPFCADRSVPTVFLDDSVVRTEEGDMSAHVEGFKFKGCYCFRAEPLSLVLRAAQRLNLDTFPKVLWAGDVAVDDVTVPVRGLLLGVGM